MAKTKKPGPRRTGWSLHVGLNAVDSDHYEGWDGKLGRLRGFSRGSCKNRT